MTGKEIILKAFNFEPTPRIPVAILDGYVWMLRRNQISFKEFFELEDYGAAIAIEAFDDWESDMVHSNMHAMNYLFEIMGGTICADKAGEAFEVTKPPLDAITDIEKYNVDEVWETLKNRPEYIAHIKLMEKLKEHYGDEKLVIAGSVAPLSLAGMLRGVQNFMAEIFDEEDVIEQILEFATELLIRHCEFQIAHGADAVFVADPVASGDLISPAMFEEFALPYIKKMTDALSKYNVPFLLHMCGHTQARLEPLKEAGIQGFSLAAVDLKEALDTAKGSYAIFGNMDPFAVLQSLSVEGVYEHCKNLGEIAGLNGGYVMMPGCDLAPATPLENIKAMVKAAYDVTN